MVATGFIVIDNEMFQIDSFGGPTSLTVTRAQEGTVAAGHSNGSIVTIFDPPSRNQDILIEDINDAVSVVRVKAANAAFGVNDWIKVGSEFMKITVVAPDTTGLDSIKFKFEADSGSLDLLKEYFLDSDTYPARTLMLKDEDGLLNELFTIESNESLNGPR